MQTVFILPESNEDTICVRYTGTVSADDFDRYHHQELVRRAQERGFFNMVVLYDSEYEGWEGDAAAANLRSIISLTDKARKLAYVNPKKRKVFLMSMVSDLLVNAEIRYFDEGEYQQAVEWVNNNKKTGTA